MAEQRFDRTRVEKFLHILGAQLDGEWLLVGGGAAAAWFAPSRTTEDLDIIGLSGSQEDRFALMELAASEALPIEAVNSAADFFVRRIPNWRAHLVELHRGTKATVYRPDATLFLRLKLGRLSEVDLDDCLALLDYCDRTSERVAIDEVVAALAALPANDDEALTARRERLRERLYGAPSGTP